MKNQIYKALRSLDEFDITALTTRATFNRGLEYFSSGRVLAFSWHIDPSSKQDELVALIRGTATTYQIKIKLNDDDNLEYFCNCPAWENYDMCKHVVCTLLTASHILNDKQIPGFSGPALKKQLMGNSETADIDKIQEQPRKSSLSLHLIPPRGNAFNFTRPHYNIALFDGTKGLHLRSPLAPDMYAPFLDAGLKAERRDKLFREALARQAITIPITVHTQERQISLTYDGQQLADQITELIIIDDHINIRQLAALPGQAPMQEIIRISEKLIIDVAQKKLVIVGKGHHWDWVERIFNQTPYSWPSIPLEDNPERPPTFKQNLSSFPIISNPVIITTTAFNRSFPLIGNNARQPSAFILKQNGKIASPIPILPTLAIECTIDKERQLVYVYPHVLINGNVIPLDYQLHRHLEKIDDLGHNWLRTKARRTMLMKTVFTLIGISNGEAAKKLIEKAAHDIRADYRGNEYAYTGQITGYLESFFEHFLANNSEQIVADAGQFYHITLDYRYLWRSFAILSNLFGEYFINQSKQTSCFSVPLPIFFDTFAELEKTVNAHNIELRLNKKRVQTMALDISVDASQAKSGDWFDLAPHILSQGIALTSEQRDMLFSGDGMIETADCITILDTQTRQILALLAKMFTPMGKTASKSMQNIVQLPRLRVLDLLELRKSGATVTFSPADELLVQSLTNFSKIEKIPLPKQFVGELRDYQQAGYRWLAFLYKHHFGACLADDMGLGKTIQAIAFLGGIAEGIIENQCPIKTPHLIVLPPTLLFNWQHELQKFYPALRVMAYAGPKRNRNFEGADVVLTTYDTVRLDIEHLKTMTFHTLILDEAQAIKNIQSARAAAVRQLKGIFTISLTGTPLENHIGEYYSIIDIALPGLLPVYKKFMSSAKKDEADNLIKKMNTFVLRRTKDMILKELPPKVESNIVLDMAPKQKKLYATTVAEVKRMIDHAYDTKTGAQANIIALTAILRLRQICVSPQLIDAKSIEDSPKIDYLVETLTELVQEGHAALVFSQFTTCLNLVEKALRDAELEYFRIDGSTPMAQRKKIVESFQSNNQKVPILLLSLKTGGVGLNLTRANYVFHIDPWWNPAVENQASDRSHRIGQKKTVFVTRLVMHHSIEEKMMALKEEKQKLFKDVMENAENKKTSLISKKDFDLLLS